VRHGGPWLLPHSDSKEKALENEKDTYTLRLDRTVSMYVIKEDLFLYLEEQTFREWWEQLDKIFSHCETFINGIALFS